MYKLIFILFVFIAPSFVLAQSTTTKTVNKKLYNYIHELEDQFQAIPNKKKEKLDSISAYILENQRLGKVSKISFVSKNNAQRTQLCQIWLDAAAKYYGLREISSFSAGYTPKTFSPKIVDALKRSYLLVEKMSNTGSVAYQVMASKKSVPLLAYAKSFSDGMNPKKDYMAVFVQEYSEAIINMLAIGSNQTIFLNYLEPIEYSKKKMEIEEYDALCKTIALDMVYVVYSVTRQMN